jgi:hypothetical protein
MKQHLKKVFFKSFDFVEASLNATSLELDDL